MPNPDASPAATSSLERIEHAIEQVVEEALAATERTLAQRFGAGFVRAVRLALRAAFAALVVACFGFGLALLATRYWLMPRIDQARPWLEAEASRVLATNVSIGRISAAWQGFHPQLKLGDVRLQAAGGGAALALPQLDVTVSWWSLPRLSLRLRSLSMLAPELEVRRLADGRYNVAGFRFDPQASKGDGGAFDWLLSQRHLEVREARLRYVEEAAGHGPPREVSLADVNLVFRAGLSSHRFALQAQPPSDLGTRIDLRAEIDYPWAERPSDISRWSGRLYAQMDYVDLARLHTLLRALPAPLVIERASGAVRAWLDFDRLQPTRISADLALVDVSAVLGAALAPLQVASVQGRFTQRRWGNELDGGNELQLRSFALQGKQGPLLPPTDLRLRLARATEARPRRGEFEASRVSLEAVAYVAEHVPLARDLQQLIARRAVRGTLTAVEAQWEGEAAVPTRFSIRTRFDGLASAAQAATPPLDELGRPRVGLPGFDNLAGSLEATETGGALSINARAVELDLPGLLEPPRVALAQLTAKARWSVTSEDGRNARLEQVRVESFTASNDDLDLAVSGSWRRGGRGPGLADLSGRINRLALPALARYLPTGAGPQTRAWLAAALLGGQASDATFRLRGDLHDFPFADAAKGEFRLAGRARNATLDYQPTSLPALDGKPRQPWPVITAIDADVLLERHTLRVTGRSGTIFGTRLSNVVVQAPDLQSRDAHLLVTGVANGPLADMVRYVNDTPLGARLGNFLANTVTGGNARLDLDLDIPLVHGSDTRVKGALTLAGNDLVLTREIPALARAGGRIEFTEKGFRLVNAGASFVGGLARFDGGTRADGATEISVSGSATPQGARRAVDVALAQRLLERAQGTARYSGTVVVRNKRVDLRVDSDLVGWSIDGPPPARKSASEIMPLRFEMGANVLEPEARAPDRDAVALGLGNLLAVRLERVRMTDGNQPRIVRGLIALGAEALGTPLPAAGVLASVALARLDVDRWLPLLDGALGDNAAGTTPRTGAGLPDLVAARVRELVIFGKPVANVVLGATRAADGPWNINLASDQATGALTWRPPQAGNPGGITARLARLAIPQVQHDELTDLLEAAPSEVPAFDVIAEDFELAGRKLGRLELMAQNAGGAAPTWQLQKLDISNPDGHLSASGQWRRDPGTATRRMTLQAAIEFSNAGGLLTRLGAPGAIRGGAGKLDGELSWRGSPLALDLPSLSGKLRLESSKGQFLKADAGAARLLGVMSLQSLPSRITLDFRDVFSEGFAFDSIGATAELKSGLLTTRDFRMRGVTANVVIEGSADLRNETQNLHVLVLPNVNAGSASLAYALLANPVIGLSTFLAQLVLRDPLSKAFSFEYDITGSWAEPQIKRRSRQGPDATEANR